MRMMNKDDGDRIDDDDDDDDNNDDGDNCVLNGLVGSFLC